MATIEEVVARLAAVEEDLSEIAVEKLRQSLEEGDGEAAKEERRITRARRSVEKATQLLANGRGEADDIA